MTYRIPTQDISLAGNFHFGPILKSSKDSYYTRLTHMSKPISVYKNNNSKKCGKYYYTESDDLKAVCFDDVYFPLGKIGCLNDSDCKSSQKCIQFHCAPQLSKDRNPNDINFILVAVYLDNNQEEKLKVESYLKSQLDAFSDKWRADSKNFGLERERQSFKYKKCSLSRSELSAILEESSIDYINSVLDQCGVDREIFTHTYLVLSFDKSSNTDSDPLYKLQYEKMGKVFAQGLYFGDGKIKGTISAWNINNKYTLAAILFHEVLHSFGAPDLYVDVDHKVIGASYLWGNCMLMKAENLDLKYDKSTGLTFDFLSYQLCPLEQYYFGVRN